jgi:hypothetical protein
MSVVAKFFVQSVEKTEGASTASKINLGAVCRGVENAGWASATPAGNMTIWSLNEYATDYFEQGAEYEITLTKVAKPMPGDRHPAVAIKTKYGSYICQTCGGVPQWDSAKFDWQTVPLSDLDWTMHDTVYSPSPTE